MRQHFLGALLLAGSTAASTSCVSAGDRISKDMASWVGHTENELIADWGNPTRQVSDDNGGKIFVYEFQRESTSPAVLTTHKCASWEADCVNGGRAVYQPSSTSPWTVLREFWIDGDGVIYKWKWKGQ
jgi:hypothetical protein